MQPTQLPLDQIIPGNCLSVLTQFPEKSIDLIFADPPYNLQLKKALWRPNSTRVDGVDELWDQFPDFESYDRFTEAWIKECRRVLKDTGTIWVIGSYHNIFRVGRIIQDLGFWILNDIVWIKNNPMPNFRGVRFTNAHETLIWAQKVKGKKYTFNYQTMKAMNNLDSGNGAMQMRSDWKLPLCTGKERLRVNGVKAHPTQKPESLLKRVILSSSNTDDVVLDPFFGSGTTGAVAKRYSRHWIGIEEDESYISFAQQRIDAVEPDKDRNVAYSQIKEGDKKRIPFHAIIQAGYLTEGESIFFGKNSDKQATVVANGKIKYNNLVGSIHKVGREIQNAPCNGWLAWYYTSLETGKREPLDFLRKRIRKERAEYQTEKLG